MTSENRAEAASRYLAAAERALSASDRPDAQRHLGSFLSESLWDALRRPTEETVVEQLRSGPFAYRLPQFLGLSRELARDDLHRMTHLSTYPLFHFGQAAWWIDWTNEGDDLVRLGMLKEPLAKTTSFWREYGRGVAAICSGTTYSPSAVKAVGAEKYWLPYLDLAAALTGLGDVNEALVAVDDSFNRRNRDRRVSDTGQDYDGNGHAPQAVNFRKFSLLKRANRPDRDI